jgi:uncharacterized SAM-binding protein YcdF (DUF218 family)
VTLSTDPGRKESMRNQKRHRLLIIFLCLFFVVLSIFIFRERILRSLGELIVQDETAKASDAVIVLNTGLEYYPRLIEAADLYRERLAEWVVINGNRKDEVLRSLEKKGLTRCCPWDEESLRILTMLGVPREKVISISVEDAYDTVSEATAVGEEIIRQGWGRIIITTSKYHSRRAHYIWKTMFGDQLTIYTVPAKSDPFNPSDWWKDGRQIRWVMTEYGAWIYYWWKKFKEI